MVAMSSSFSRISRSAERNWLEAYYKNTDAIAESANALLGDLGRTVETIHSVLDVRRFKEVRHVHPKQAGHESWHGKSQHTDLQLSLENHG
jgi:hypothetical protein